MTPPPVQGRSVVARLGRRLRLPAIEEEEDRRAAGFVATLAAVAGASALVGAVTVLARTGHNAVTSALLAGYALLCAFSLWLLRRGRVPLAGRVIFLVTTAAATGLVLTGTERGFRDVAMMIYPVLAIFASLFLRRRDFALGLGLIVATLLAVLAADLWGSLDPGQARRDALTDFANATLIVLLAGLAARLVADYMEESARRLRENQAALASANRQLEADAVEREGLIRELETRNAELESFAYTVTHDLKSPLITIGGFLPHIQAHAERGDQAALRDDVGRVRHAQTRMLRMLDELLELSRAGRPAGRGEPLALAEVAREARELAGGRLRARGVRVSIADDLPRVRGDRVRLVQVFQNLLDNAAKFAGDAADPQVVVGVRDEGAERVVFVRDNGIGIDPAHRERVFGLFQRLDPDQEGTGIGLALVERIIRTHGGRVWIESRGRGQGTCVCFTLPVVAEPEPPGAEPA